MAQENYITKVEFDRTINFTAVITGFKLYFDEMSSPTVVLAAKNTKKRQESRTDQIITPNREKTSSLVPP